MDPVPETAALFLQLAVGKGMIGEPLAKQVLQESGATARHPSAILLERGILTAYQVDNLHREVQKAMGPKTIGGFLILEKIGQGGMGVVYRARQLSMDRVVALKVLADEHAANAEFCERFLREAHAAAKVDHPNVVTVHDVGKDDGMLFLAMQFVGGGDVERLASSRGGRLPPYRAVEIIRDAAKGLAAIHRAGLIHRDIKPANIFLTEDGMAKLADLGLSRSNAGDDRMTTTGSIMGTPAYMAPEQALGAVDLDIRCDIYSLGATLYALLTGKPPFSNQTPMATVLDVVQRPFPDPAEACPGLDAGLGALIRRCTAKERGERIQDPADLVAALEGLLLRLPGDAPPEPPPGSPPASSSAEACTLIMTPAAANAHRVRRVAAPPAEGRGRMLILVLPLLVLSLGVAASWGVLRHRAVTQPRPAQADQEAAAQLIQEAIATLPATASDEQVEQTRSRVEAYLEQAPEAQAARVRERWRQALEARRHEDAAASAPKAAAPRRPPWAAASAKDQYGVWADLSVGGVTQRFRWVQPDSFMMGSPQVERDAAVPRGCANAEWFADEFQHQVTISSGFWLADSACTQALWQAVTGANPAYFDDHPERPVERVSWNEVQDLLAALARRTPGRCFRLPTEAEWEFACRAGSTQATYNGDPDYRGERHAPALDTIAWYAGNSGNGWSGAKGFDSSLWSEKQYPHVRTGTWPVKQRRPNRWGLYDMLGNVWQWCADWYGEYPAGAVTDPTGPATGSERVLRGGSWRVAAYDCRAARRNRDAPGARADTIGFRLAAQSQDPR